MENLDYKNMPVKTLIRKLAIPSIISMMVASLNMVTDGIFMGNFIGSDALAAVNIIMPFVMVTFSLIDMVGSGCAVKMGIYFGEKNEKQAGALLSTSAILILTLGILISIFGALFAKDLIFTFIEDENLAVLAYDYIKVVIPFMPFIAPLFAFDNYLRVCGKAKYSMWVSVLTSFINIILNAILVAYLGLGISYGALATALSMCIGSVFCILPFVRGELAIKFEKPSTDLKEIRLMLYNGSSDFFANISGSVMVIMMNAILLKLAGADGVSALSVVSYVEMLLMPLLAGLITCIQPMVSFNYGAKNYDRMRETFKIICKISISISLVMIIIMVMFPQILISLFASEGTENMKNIARVGLLLTAPSYLLNWFNVLVGIYLTSIEKAKESIILMTLESMVFPIICYIIFISLIGVNGVFLASSVAAVATGIISIFMYNKHIKILK